MAFATVRRYADSVQDTQASPPVIVYRYKVSYGIGSMIAAFLSWLVNKSFIWAFVHFFFGWFYVVYACCAYQPEIDAALTKTVANP